MEDVDTVVEYDRAVRDVKRRRKDDRRRYRSGSMELLEMAEYTEHLESEIRQLRELLEWHTMCSKCMHALQYERGFTRGDTGYADDESREMTESEYEQEMRLWQGTRAQARDSDNEIKKLRRRIARLEKLLHESGF